MTSSSRKVLLASIFGNALEFYDFTLYGVFAAIIANHFFPGNNETSKLLSSLAAFAVGFLTRPIGAVLFGYIGDKFGRRKALSLSILLMGLPTFLIGIIPGYEQIGLIASISVFACRLMQGVFTGGEYNGAAIFSIEHIGKKYPGFIGGLITGSCVIGAWTATFLGSLTQGSDMPTWVWRLPFMLGAVISIIGFYIRRSIMETPEFLLAESMGLTSKKIPLMQALILNPASCLMSFMMGGYNGALSYTLFGFLNIYLSRYLEIPMGTAMQFNLFGLFAFMIGSPLMGYFLDLLGSRKFYLGTIICNLFFAIPIFLGISSKIPFLIIISQVLLGLCTASIAGSGHAFMQTLFPVSDRYSGISFNFSLGMGIFGGLTPIIYVNMIENYQSSLLFPAFYLMGLTAVFGFILINLPSFKKNAAINTGELSNS